MACRAIGAGCGGGDHTAIGGSSGLRRGEVVL